MESTMPTGMPAASSVGPCSTWSSSQARTLPGARRQESTASGSRPAGPHGVGEPHAVGIFRRSDPIGGDLAGNRLRAQHAAEAALLFRRRDHFDRRRRRNAGITHRAHAFERYRHAERAVEGAAFRHRVEMRAGHDAGALGRAEAAEDVAGRVAPDRQAVGLHLAGEPSPHGHVGLGKTRPVEAAGFRVAAEAIDAVEQRLKPGQVDGANLGGHETSIETNDFGGYFGG